MLNKNYSIRDIEKLSYNYMMVEAERGNVERIQIKEHECFLVDFVGYFGYSILVYKNGHYIHYANDYQLHHRTMEKKDLKNLYIESLNKKLYTESELLEPVTSYDDYTKKSYYLRNYWNMQFDYVSMFCIGERGHEEKKKIESMIFNPVCFCYMNDKDIVKKAILFEKNLEKSYKELSENLDVFRNMISFELANHEACITCDYRDALDALGLKFTDLSTNKQKIVLQELKKQMDAYEY